MGKRAKNRAAFLGALIGGQLIFSAVIGWIFGDFGAATLGAFAYAYLVSAAFIVGHLSWEAAKDDKAPQDH